MGIINEIKHVYDALNKLNRYELNNIIAERITIYSYSFLDENEIRAIKNEFGSVESFSNILAESFTRNNGSFDNFTLNEGISNESLWSGAAKLLKGGKRIAGNGAKWVGRKMTGKPVGKVVERFGKQELDDIAKFVGKHVDDVTHVDIGKYVTKNLTKNANKSVVKQLEKQASWLSKNTNMNAKQMEEFMAKYAKCPSDCDPKIWKKAFEEEAKAYHSGVKMENGLVRARYKALARESGKIGTSVAETAGKTSLTRKMFNGVKWLGKKIFSWNFIKIGGLIYLVYLGKKYLWDKVKGWVLGEDGNSGNSEWSGALMDGSLESVYPKTYGREYLGENPEDYRII